MNPTYSVTVGIVALNEDRNIKKMILSVLDQIQDTYTIEKILVISDGSTDNTVAEVKSINNKLIELHEFEHRIGKSSHLNTLFNKSETDIVVLFDADIVLGNEDTITNLIKPLTNSEKIMFVGGNPLPTPGKTFIEKAVNVSCYPYIALREVLNNGNTPYGCDGRILALKKEFYKKVVVPVDMIANDNFMYFACITSRHSYQYVKNAVVYYRSPSTYSDQIRQNKRFIAARQRLTRIFGKVAEEAYHIPTSLKIKHILLQLLKSPILSLSIFVINKYCMLRAIFEERFMNAKWAIAETTKNTVEFEKLEM